MREARLNGRLIQAGPQAPETARCPECDAEVRLRKRRVGRNGRIFFYRHRSGQGDPDCPQRYRPVP